MPTRLSAPLRALLAGACLIALAGCSSIFGTDDETNNANKDAAAYRERSVEQIYADGWRMIGMGTGTAAPPPSTRWTASIPIRCGRAAPC